VTRLQIDLLGGFDARLDGAGMKFRTRKIQALVAYLAVPLAQAHTRDTLTALLWGDLAPRQARAGLRQALFSLRQSVGDDVLQLEAEHVALVAPAVDVARFEAVTEKMELARSHAAAAASHLRALGMTFWLPEVARRLARG
jgi:DNA-binding SARP family transcriptional activator